MTAFENMATEYKKSILRLKALKAQKVCFSHDRLTATDLQHRSRDKTGTDFIGGSDI